MNVKLASALAAMILTAGMFGSTAMAAQSSSATKTKNIELNGQSVTKPAGLVHNGTTYMPIYYLEAVLKKLGISNTWNGQTKTWSLNTASYMQPDMQNIAVGSGSATITLNGTPIQKVDSVAAVDPASGVMTTYMPIWYLQRILNRVDVTSNWTGTIWNLKTSLNYVGNSQANIVKYVEQVTTDLSSTSDVIALTQELYNEGYVTSNFVNETKQYFTPTSWADISQNDQIQSLKLLLFHVVTQDTTSTPNEDDLITTEVDTVTYTDTHYYWSSQTNEWKVLQDGTTGIWQVDDLQNLDNQSSSSSSSGPSSSSSGSASSSSSSNSTSGSGGSTSGSGTTNSTSTSGSPGSTNTATTTNAGN